MVKKTPHRDGIGIVRAAALLFAIFTLWIGMRILFFKGLTGSDDLRYVRFALTWDHAPVNIWEARLLGNALTTLSIYLFGFSEPALILPSLAASFTLLIIAMKWAHRIGGWRAVPAAGGLMAMTPVDVDAATMVSPFTIMAAFMSVGSYLYLTEAAPARAIAGEQGRSTTHPISEGWFPSIRANGPFRSFLAGGLLGVGVMTHLAGFYLWGILLTVSIAVDRRHFLGKALVASMCLFAALLLDMSAFALLFGDPLGRFHASTMTFSISPPFPWDPVRQEVNWKFFWEPLAIGLYSKGLGLLPLAFFAAVLRFWKTGDRALRIMTATVAGLAVWMAYGTLVPWAYHPFFRYTRFLLPIVPMLAVGVAYAATHRSLGSGPTAPRLHGYGRWVVATISVTGALNLLCSGSWGESVEVSRHLRSFVLANPTEAFVTDYRTFREINVLSALHPPANLSFHPLGLDGPPPHDGALLFVPDRATETVTLLVNSLQRDATYDFAQWIEREASPAVMTLGETSFRPICKLLPPLERWKWSIRRPPGLAIRFDRGRELAIQVD